MKKKDNFIKRAITFSLVFIAVSLLIFSLYNNMKINIVINYDEPKINELMNIDIYVKKGSKNIEAESMHIELNHKYRRDESVSLDLTPYATGEYHLSYYPQVQGDYILELDAVVSGEEIYKTENIKVG